jgi:hypothetical protein
MGGKIEDEEFLLQLATAYLATTLKGEVARKQLKIKKEATEIFVKVLITIIKTVAITSLKATIA